MSEVATLLSEMGAKARTAAQLLATANAAQKTTALEAIAAALRAQSSEILGANARDMASATHLDEAMRDRLLLTPSRAQAMTTGVATIAALPDPVGRVLDAWDVAANGLHIEKVAVPLGVIGIIYEARPNVTADAAALALKAGNAVILRCGSECLGSAMAILAAIHAGLKQAGLPLDSVQLVPTTDREAVAEMLTMHEHIDVIIPRGGKSLTDRVRREARVPTLLHLDGNCHLYIDAKADPEKARRLVMNAKLRRTGICGALESLLIDRAAPECVFKVLGELLDAGCELRGDETIRAHDPRILAASESDWSTEYLASILSIKTVSGVAEAIAHINRYGSHHTDGIITEDKAAIDAFTRGVDSAIVTVNASTQFADGGEFGFGAEIGIATGRLHARGPVGAPELTTYKYILTTTRPDGATRAG